MSIPQIDLVLNPRIKDAALMSRLTTFAGKRHSDSDMADLQAIHDLAAKQGAACTSGQMSRRVRPPQTSGKEQNNMTKWERFKALFADDSDDEDDEPTSQPARRESNGGMSSAEKAELETLRKFRNDQLVTQRANVKAQAVAAFGQGTPALASAEKVIETATTEMLDALSATYVHMKPSSGGRQSQATDFSGGGAVNADNNGGASGPLATFDAALGKETARLKNMGKGGN